MYPTLTDRLQEIVQESPDQTVILWRLEDAVKGYTYGQFYQTSRQVASWLLGVGVRKGDRVALLLENRPEWPMAYFGILLAGGVGVPIDLQSRPDLIAYILNQTQARVLVASPQAPLAEIQGLPNLEKIVVVGQPDAALHKAVSFDDILKAPETEESFPPGAPEDLASIIYTSGTTGPPKGVMLTHKNFYANFLSLMGLQVVRPGDNFLSILPLFHVLPFTATVIVPLLSKNKITYLGTLKADMLLQCIREQKVTLLPVTPQVLQHFYNGIKKRFSEMPLGLGWVVERFLSVSWKFSRVMGFNPARPLLKKIKASLGPQFRYFISGGAKLPLELAQNLSKVGLEVAEGYGLTETSPGVAINPPQAPKPGSVGPPLKGVEVRILDPDSEGIGEILIRGDNVMAGYYQNDAATLEAIRDGWFHSGDLGCQDKAGYLYIKERLKDIIVLSSGKNISSEEVSNHYLQASTIKEIHVMPDPREEKLVAVVVPDFEHFRASGEADIYGEVKWELEFYSQQLESYKRVRDFVLVNRELPKTRLGKVKRHEAAALYREKAGKRYGKRKLAREEELSEAGRAVVKIMARQVGSDQIALDDHLELDLGLDSLGMVELIAALEERLNITIQDGEFSEVFTLGELIRAVEAKQPEVGAAEEKVRSWTEILQDPPSPALLNKISLKKGIGAYCFTTAWSWFVGLIFGMFFRPKVYGREGLGDQGYILCPNHVSFLDGFLLFRAAPKALRHHLFFMGYSKYFEAPLVRSLVRMRVIPVNSARFLVDSMLASAYVLRRGGVMAIFPEGSRSVSGKLMEFKKGVAILAKELDIKLVPVFIDGTYEAWPPAARFPRPHPTRIIFGREFSAAELKETGLKIKPEAQDYEAITLGLREEVLRLGKELEDEAGGKSG